jgi:outer membrane protein assembly factor BamD
VAGVKRWPLFPALVGFCLLALPFSSPAPLIFRPGEGWSYERLGGEGKWQRARSQDQLEVAQTAFDQADYGLAIKAARRVGREWPMSDHAPAAQFLVGRCFELRNQDEKAFKEYQNLLKKYPKAANYDDVLQRQYAIAARFLGGQWFKLWGYIPFFPSMDKTAGMFEKIVRNGPFSDIAPHAQLRVGAAREREREYPLAVKAYDVAADRYFDRPTIASDAVYRAGMAYYKQAKKAEYDQGAAGKAIASFTDFTTLFPQDRRVANAQQLIAALKREQARGSYEIARFYEKNKRWAGAVVYYNEVLLLDAQSPHAEEARRRIEMLKAQTQPTPAPAAN